MIKVYFNLLPDIPYIPLLYPNLGIQRRDTILFLNDAFTELDESYVEIVKDMASADYVLLPHNYSALKEHKQYVEEQVELASNYHKKIIIFAHGDSDEIIPYHNAIIFRTSQYGYKLQANEIMMPAYAADLLGDHPLNLRSKTSEKPIIGFCGWVNYKNFKNRIGTIVLNTIATVRSLLGKRFKVHMKGITFRVRAIRSFEENDRIDTHFVIRRSYSGHASTIQDSPEKLRKEYVENMQNSDFALVVKGDGNYSYRFYEALSLGRIPVLIDTDYVLPLEKIIPYKDFVIFIDYTDVHMAGDILADRFSVMSDEQFKEMQKKAREAFEKYLNIKSYLRYVVDHLL